MMPPLVGTHGPCIRQPDETAVSPNEPTTVQPAEPTVSPHQPDNQQRLRQRKNIRAEFHDYSGGKYFVTICTRDKSHYFGKIKDESMHYTPVGKYCKLHLEQIGQHYHYAEVPLFVVMPNHIHAIICIDPSCRTHGPCINTNHPSCRTHGPCVPTVRTALSVVVGGLKRAVTMFARRNGIEFCWQSRYHDHIIRGVQDGNKIADYIENNVVRWKSDCFNVR